MKLQFLTNMHYEVNKSTNVSCFSSKLVKHSSLDSDNTEDIDISTSLIEV